MGTIEDIIKAIDYELIEKGKLYLDLGPTNKLLLSRGLISVAEKRKQSLKKILENNLIPHAYQTSEKPRQWRIPLSEQGLKEKEKNIKPTINFCPYCGTSISNSIEYLSDSNQSCLSCGRLFSFNDLTQYTEQKKYYPKPKKYKSTEKDILSKSAPYVIAVAILLTWFFLDEAGFKFNKTFDYKPTTYITQSGFMGAYTEESLDKFTEYAVHKDYRAIERLISYGDIFKLPSGIEVYIVESSFTIVKIRLKGKTDEIWTVTEAIKKSNKNNSNVEIE